ncbi:MAG: hypothetical protein F6J94_18970 [Moorea sp. SIO1F2]|uniref:hypothetical protein n=1 Tax=Moorena sp. SIO1F2 TaxID=2607819 RepID=UPI0013BA7230|nr:hypothetical protein [Moorena sp. SIO1F2]NET83926.1 hypothetical protein [Moorena sp. SIO1F2]
MEAIAPRVTIRVAWPFGQGQSHLSSPLSPSPHTSHTLPYSLLPTPYSLLPTPYSLLPTPYS